VTKLTLIIMLAIAVQFEISGTAETILHMLDCQSTRMVRGSFLFLHSVQNAKRRLR